MRVERPTDLESVVPKWSRSDHRNKPEGGIGQSHSSDSIPITPRPLQLFEPQFIPFPGLGKEWRLRMSKARGFTNQRIMIILLFRTSGNLETHILPNHSACSFLARNMQLVFFNPRFGLACSWPGQASRRQRHPLPLFPKHIAASILGLRTKSRLLLNFRHGLCNPLKSVSHVPCRATGVPAEAFILFPRPSRAVLTSCFPVDYSY